MKLSRKTRGDLRSQYALGPASAFATAAQGSLAVTALQPGQAATTDQGARADLAYGWGDHASSVAAASAAAAAAQASADAAQAGVDAVPALIVAARGQVALFNYTVASGAGGGDRALGLSAIIALNTTVYNGISTSVALNAVTGAMTFQPGTYFIRGEAVGYRIGGHRAALYRSSPTTDVLAYGSNAYAFDGAFATTSVSVVSTVAVFVAETVIQLQHYAELTRAVAGGGFPLSVAGVSEVYHPVLIVRLA